MFGETGYTAAAVLDGCAAVGYRESLRASEKASSLQPGTTMTKAILNEYRQQLQALRSRLTGDVNHLADEALRKAGGEASGSLSNMPIHMADLGTDNFEQEFTLSLLENEEQALEEIGAALDRINKGTFGMCEECGKEIPRERLKALPYARRCVACARKQEQGT
jgi:RNA polymerase-binding protein DksA